MLDSLFDPKNRIAVKIGVWAVVSLLIALTVGITGLIGMAINAVIASLVAGVSLTILDAVVALYVRKKPIGFMLYKRAAGRQFSAAVVLGLMFFAKNVTFGSVIADAAVFAVNVTTFMVSFALGSLLWANRSQVMQTALDLKDGKADLGEVAMAAGRTLRDTAVQSVRTTAARAQSAIKR